MLALFSLNAVNKVLSSSCGAYSTSSTSGVDATNLSCSITVSGNRPVLIALVPDLSGNESSFWHTNTGATYGAGYWAKILRGSDLVFSCFNSPNQSNTTVGQTYTQYDSISRVSVLDRPAAGTYTYKVQVLNENANSTVGLNYAKLLCLEMLY